MLLLRYFWWALVIHFMTIHKQTPFGFLNTLVRTPYWMFAAYMNLAVVGEKELVREGVQVVAKSWVDGTSASPPLWAREGFLSLGRLA